MASSDEFARDVADYFDLLHREVFEGDPAANPNLTVEVMGSSLAHDTPICVLLAPWTLCGLAQPPDGALTTPLRVGHTHYPALENTVEGIGHYWTVVMIPDVSHFPTQEDARSRAEDLVDPFRVAVEQVRLELTEVANESRRSLLRGQIGTPNPAATPFGDPGQHSALHPGS